MFLGQKKVKEAIETEEKTPGGNPILLVKYEDETEEHIPKVMYDEVVSRKSCSLEDLRDKRCRPVVAQMLSLMSEWGIKLSELGYVSALLNQSLDFNKENAICALWADWMPRPNAGDEVDLCTVDRVLKAKANGVSGKE